MTRARWVGVAATALAVAAVGVVVAASGDSAPQPSASDGARAEAKRTGHGGRLHGTFELEPPTMGALVDRAPAAVEATVTDVETRIEDPSGLGGHADGSGLVPKQRITFRTDDRIYGDAPPTFAFEKVGSQENWMEGDPPYHVGERYLLFIEPLGGGFWGRTTRIGRLKVDSEGKVKPLVDGELSEKLKGREKKELKDEIKEKKSQAKGE